MNELEYKKESFYDRFGNEELAKAFEYAKGYKTENMRTKTAALLRKVMPAGGDYEKAGWSRVQVSSLW